MGTRHRGFTLIEIMMALVIVAVIASIAVPSYRSYLVRAQRSDATAALLKVQTAQEKLYLQQGKFSTNLTNRMSDATPGLGLPSAESERGYYQITVTLTDSGYVATAAPITGRAQAKDSRCVRFTVNESGVRRAFDASDQDRTDECWR